jgi:hypothetical protein
MESGMRVWFRVGNLAPIYVNISEVDPSICTLMMAIKAMKPNDFQHIDADRIVVRHPDGSRVLDSVENLDTLLRSGFGSGGNPFLIDAPPQGESSHEIPLYFILSYFIKTHIIVVPRRFPSFPPSILTHLAF